MPIIPFELNCSPFLWINTCDVSVPIESYIYFSIKKGLTFTKILYLLTYSLTLDYKTHLPEKSVMVELGESHPDRITATFFKATGEK